MNPLWTEQEVAAYLKLRVRTVQDWRLDGKGPIFLRIGRLVRYRREDVENWLQSRRGDASDEFIQR